MRDGNIANVNGVRLDGCQYNLQRVRYINIPLYSTSANPEAGIQISGLNESDTEGWKTSNSNRKFTILCKIYAHCC
jgi:hypothetical protein